MPPSRLARLSDAAVAKKRISTMGTSTLRTPLSNKTNVVEVAAEAGGGKVNLKTPLQAAKLRDSGKTPQTQARIAKAPGGALGAVVQAQSAVAGRLVSGKPLDRARPLPPKLTLPAHTPQSLDSKAASMLIQDKENLPVPSGSLSSLIEQAGFEEKAKALEDEFARKNKEAEDAWNLKAEELQKQIEAAKEDQEAAMKAQFDLAALLRSQREKYEETINKLCNELGETRVKLQLSEEQKQQLEQEHDHHQQEQHQQHEQQMQAAAATNTQVQEVSQPSATEPSPEMIQKIRDECAAEFFETLQALETDLNSVQINMDRQLEELKQQVLSAQQAQQEAESKLAAQQEQHSAEMAQLQEEFAQALQAALKLAEEQEASKAQHQTNAEDQMREMQVEYEKQTLQRETEWSAKLDSLREQMDLEKQQSLEEHGRAHEVAMQEKNAQWTSKIEALQQELELAKQAEQEAFNTQRELATLLDQGQQKYELEQAQLSGKCEALRQELEAARQAEGVRHAEAEARHELVVSELRAALAAEKEERRREGERAHQLESSVGDSIAQLTATLARKRELRAQERDRFPPLRGGDDTMRT